VGRILFVTSFVNSGVGHLRHQERMEDYAKGAGMPFPLLAGWPAGLWLLAGSASIVLGAWGDIGALGLGLFVILAAGYFHRFWEVADPEQRHAQRMNFTRNATYLGAALALFAVFASAGPNLPLTLTGPLFEL
jgi:uncharacterized membrane protein YphA (DoxX/SURF4 family)